MNKQTRYLLFIWLALSVGMAMGCQKDPIPGPRQVDTGDDTSAVDYRHGIIVLNEGNFQMGNASVSWYNPQTGHTRQHLFSRANNRSLGDVAQSFTRYKDKGYIAVNNSQKIEVVNLKDFTSLATIEGLTAPRYIHIVNDAQAYVTDLYANAVHLFHPANFEITGKIAIDGWTEAITQVGEYVYVTNMDHHMVHKISVATNEVVDTLHVPAQPNSIRTDRHDKLWVLCDGGFEETYPALVRVNPATMQIEQQLDFPDINASPDRLQVNDGGDRLFYLSEGVYTLTITAQKLPHEALIPAQEHNNFYGLGYDAMQAAIYVTDAKDFTRQGIVWRYDISGVEVDSFTAGNIPQDISF